jgi:small subunit ribosomal protein S17
MSEVQKKAKPLKCIVVSDKCPKTRVAKVHRRIKHDRYGKFINLSTKIMFHDEKNETKVGDEVLVSSCRPLSKRKMFMFNSILKAAPEGDL